MPQEKFSLSAQERKQTGKSVNTLRQADKLPAVLYGHKIKSQNLVLKLHEFEKVLEGAGESTLVDLKIGEQPPVKVLIYDIQRQPVSHQIIHADLYQVRMDEKITTDVELVFINESSAVKNLAGSLVKAMDSIEVECLPGDLISHIEVDISVLKTFEDVIRVKDLNVPEKIHILSDLESAVALVEEPVKEEELVVEEEKPVAEGEEGEEGAEEGAEKAEGKGEGKGEEDKSKEKVGKEKKS